MWLATMVANNHRNAVMGVKALLLEDMGRNLEEQWANERRYTTNVVRGAKAETAFPEFIVRRGRPPSSDWLAVSENIRGDIELAAARYDSIGAKA